MATQTPHKIIMKEIKPMAGGKEVQLTAAQLKALGIKVETKRKNPFDRVNHVGGAYACIDGKNNAVFHRDEDGEEDWSLYNSINYFSDEKFAIQVALHQLLYRTLLKFAYDNECEDTTEWDGSNVHWTIRHSGHQYGFFVCCQERYKGWGVCFSTKEAAKRAIEEVVEPFMEEHPKFVW